MDSRVLWELRVKVVPELQALLEFKDLMVVLQILEHKVLREHMATKDIKGHRVLRAIREPREIKVLKVHRGRVSLESTEMHQTLVPLDQRAMTDL
jgi:hypothetical protein